MVIGVIALPISIGMVRAGTESFVITRFVSTFGISLPFKKRRTENPEA
jgi:hypothetical protein